MPGSATRLPFSPRPAVFGRDGAQKRATPLQYACATAAVVVTGLFLARAPVPALQAVHRILQALFGTAIALRLTALAVSRRTLPPPTEPAHLPAYTVILPLYREAAVVPGLLAALERIDYPRDRLQLLFALEADDHATLAAVRRSLPRHGRIVVPRSGPRTKPNACNAALKQATGELVVVYDAEDRPHPGQLREAAARFAAGDARLVCLQAPLRVNRSPDFLRRQFALEYAAQFEVLLPALPRPGLAFPLGGTSNHFRREALEAVGGWDAYNVTEDADLGLKLGACGGRLGMRSLPTGEPAPPSLGVWTPQRTRWIKGHLHTWIVHMRRPLCGGLKGVLTLQLTLGLNVATALLHGPLAMGVVACALVSLVSWTPPPVAALDVGLFAAGWTSAAAAMVLGSRRAGSPARIGDVLAAPFYWPMQSLAGVFALVELALRPHHWNKTPHETQEEDAAVLSAVTP